MWWHRLRRRRRYEDDLDKELRFHLEQHTDDLIAEGYSPEEARRLARLALGGPEQVKEQCRDVRPVRWIADFFQDLRYGARTFARQPGLTAIAVLALGLGIGVNTAILSAVQGFVFRPMAIESPETLVTPYWGKKSDAEVWGEFSWANYEDLRTQNQSFTSLAAWGQVSAGISSGEGANAGEAGRADVVWGELVSEQYFDVMGVKPVLGRLFLPEETSVQNTAAVTIISSTVWRRKFESDPNVVGKTVYLNGQPFTIVGVMPESFSGSYFYLRHAFWTPVGMAEKLGRHPGWNTDRGYTTFKLLGRLKPGVTLAQAELDLNRIRDGLADLYPTVAADTRIQVTTELDGRYQEATTGMQFAGILAVCVSGLVLLLACANVANLMLARAASRAKEIGIRLAIGASRGRVVRQLLAESMLLALAGGALGLVFAFWGAGMLLATFPPVPYPVNLDFAPDAFVLKCMFVVSLCTGVVFGLAPALFASRTDLVGVIKGLVTSERPGRRRLNPRALLVVAQVAISIVVLISAGLFIRSLGNVKGADPGYRTDTLVTMMINPGLLGYKVDDATNRLFPELLRRIESSPGVQSAAMANDMPMMVGQLSRGPVVKEGESDPPPNQGVNVKCSIVTPKYFDTLSLPLVAGRDFTDQDDAESPFVVIVNQQFARRFYGGDTEAMGRRFRFAEGTPLMEIVAIARDARYESFYEDPQPYLYLPVYQHPRTGMTVAVSTQPGSGLEGVVDNVRREIASVDSQLPVFGVMTGEDNLSLAYWPPRVAATMASAFGVLALVLATMGLYSVMTFTVSQRTREIGIRRALGASLGNVIGLIVRQGMRMVIMGLTLGMAAAFVLTRIFASMLLGIGATDVATFLGVTALLAAVALLACYVPARRASRVDPLVALRTE